MIHVLFVNIATSLAESKELPTTFRILGLKGSTKEDLMNAVWSKVLEAYGGLPGNVDGTVIAVCLLMSLRLGTVRIGQQIAEEWLANIPDSLIVELEQVGPMTESAILANEDEESAVTAYYKVLELYSVNILTSMQDYSSAHEFIQYNSYLSDQQKQTFDQRIRQKEQEVEDEQNRKQVEARKAQEVAIAAAAAAAAAAAKAAAAEAEKKRLQQEALFKQQQQQPQQSQSFQKSQVKDIPNGHHVKPSSASSTSRNMTAVERISSTWVAKFKQMSINSTSIAYIMFVLLIVGLVRAQRTRLRAGLEIVASKLWETLRMGTKVTYV
ncbi:hypothetical protein Unana1_08824 [Umbelopsis nana]